MPKDQLWYTAIHEAGHVVAGLVLAIPITWISIDPTVCAGEPSALARESWRKMSNSRSMLAYAVGGFQADVNDRLRPLVAAGEIKTQEDRDLIHRYVVMFLAGGATEIAFGGRPDVSSVTGDRYQIDRVVSAVIRNGHQRDTIMRHSLRKANEISVQHRCKVECLANILIDRGTLYEQEILNAVGINMLRSA